MLAHNQEIQERKELFSTASTRKSAFQSEAVPMSVQNHFDETFERPSNQNKNKRQKRHVPARQCLQVRTDGKDRPLRVLANNSASSNHASSQPPLVTLPEKVWKRSARLHTFQRFRLCSSGMNKLDKVLVKLESAALVLATKTGNEIAMSEHWRRLYVLLRSCSEARPPNMRKGTWVPPRTGNSIQEALIQAKDWLTKEVEVRKNLHERFEKFVQEVSKQNDSGPSEAGSAEDCVQEWQSERLKSYHGRDIWTEPLSFADANMSYYDGPVEDGKNSGQLTLFSDLGRGPFFSCLRQSTIGRFPGYKSDVRFCKDNSIVNELSEFESMCPFTAPRLLVGIPLSPFLKFMGHQNGSGCVFKSSIPTGTLCGIYAGKYHVFRGDNVGAQKKKELLNRTCYGFQILPDSAGGMLGNMVVDAANIGNETRLLNDPVSLPNPESKEPWRNEKRLNLRTIRLLDLKSGMIVIGFVTKRNVMAGEEAMFNYDGEEGETCFAQSLFQKKQLGVDPRP